FGDKQGLLVAVTLHVVHGYLTEMRSLVERPDDPVEELRSLWDLYVRFAYAQPECITLIYGNVRRGEAISAAANTMKSIIEETIARIADEGRLRMSVERATALFRSYGVGFAITQSRVPASNRDPELSDIAREKALANILVTAAASEASTTLA